MQLRPGLIQQISVFLWPHPNSPVPGLLPNGFQQELPGSDH